jgi:hypothetical protein
MDLEQASAAGLDESGGASGEFSSGIDDQRTTPPGSPPLRNESQSARVPGEQAMSSGTLRVFIEGQLAGEWERGDGAVSRTSPMDNHQTVHQEAKPRRPERRNVTTAPTDLEPDNWDYSTSLVVWTFELPRSPGESSQALLRRQSIAALVAIAPFANINRIEWITASSGDDAAELRPDGAVDVTATAAIFDGLPDVVELSSLLDLRCIPVKGSSSRFLRAASCVSCSSTLTAGKRSWCSSSEYMPISIRPSLMVRSVRTLGLRGSTHQGSQNSCARFAKAWEGRAAASTLRPTAGS